MIYYKFIISNKIIFYFYFTTIFGAPQNAHKLLEEVLSQCGSSKSAFNVKVIRKRFYTQILP